MSSPDSSPAPPAIPRHAASVLLLREAHGAIEVLMTRRHENLSFMGGLWVFPGGTLSPADSSAASLSLIPEPLQLHGHRLQNLDGGPLPREQNLGLAVAAYRETFEETGVLLATGASGECCSDEVLARVHEQRPLIVSHPERFATLLHQERLQLSLERLVYWAHWITPASVPKRFDTRFFLAALPPGQTAAIDAIEATELAWMTPASFLAAARDGTMTASQPTLYNLMELDHSVRQHVSLSAILAAEARREIAPVLPKMITHASASGRQRLIVMPWDSEYHDFAGIGVPRTSSYPQRLSALPTRIASDR